MYTTIQYIVHYYVIMRVIQNTKYADGCPRMNVLCSVTTKHKSPQEFCSWAPGVGCSLFGRAVLLPKDNSCRAGYVRYYLQGGACFALTGLPALGCPAYDMRCPLVGYAPRWAASIFFPVSAARRRSHPAEGSRPCMGCCIL